MEGNGLFPSRGTGQSCSPCLSRSENTPAERSQLGDTGPECWIPETTLNLEVPPPKAPHKHFKPLCFTKPWDLGKVKLPTH